MKGAYYTLEAVIAAFIILTIFGLLFLTTPTNPEIQRSNVKNEVYKALDVLSSKGSLRSNVLNNNATGIQTDIAKFLPLTLSSSVVINNRTFNNVTSQFTEKSVDTVAVNYYIAGNSGNYTPKQIIVYVWGFK